MSPFSEFMSSAGVTATWTQMLSSGLIKGSLLLGFFAVLTLALRRASASTRHQLWTLGLVGVVLLPLLSAGLPTWGILDLPRQSPVQNNSHNTTVLEDRTSLFMGSAPIVRQESSTADHLIPAVSASRQAGPDAVSKRHASSLSSISVSTWIFSIWLAGVLFLLGSILWAVIRLRHLETSAKIVTDAEWIEMLLSQCKKLSIARCPILMRSHRDLTPMTWGLRRSRILLPANCDRWTADQRLQILVHELAHVKRRDCLVHFAVQIACLIYWFNPLVWLAARQMRIERERACDDQVLMAGAKASSYASNLLDIASSLASDNRTLAYSLAMARRSQISGRLMAVLDPKRRRLAPNRYRTVIAAALTLTLVLPLAAVGPDTQAREKKPRRTSVSMINDSGSTPYKVKWDGEIKISEDGRSIDWMSDGAYLKVEQKIDRKWRTLEVEADDDGDPVYSYKIGRKKHPFDEEAADWLGDMLEEITTDGELAFPELPELPSLPELPEMPTLPELPDLPSIPSAGSLNMLHDGSQTRITWKDDDGSSLKLEMEGGIELNEDDSGILRMEDGAYFKLEEKKGRKRIEVEAEPDRHGKPVYIYKVNRKTKRFDDEAAAWLSGILKDLLPEIAINADLRVQRAYNTGGTPGVIELLDRIDSHYSKSKHYQEYFARKGLKDHEVRDVLEHMNGSLDSPYEMATVLAANLDTFLESEQKRKAFLSCMSSLDSPYEKARVITTALNKKNMPTGNITVLLAAAEDINSDYETARVLAEVDTDFLSDDTIRDAYFKVLKSIDSDYEKSRVLSSLARRAQKDEMLREACLEAADTIDSEYEYGRVMKALR